MHVPVFGVISSRWSVVCGDRLACGSSESVRLMCPCWHVGALEIIRDVWTQATCRGIQVRRPVTCISVGIVVRIVRGHTVVTSLYCYIKDRVNCAIVKPYEAAR